MESRRVRYEPEMAVSCSRRDVVLTRYRLFERNRDCGNDRPIDVEDCLSIRAARIADLAFRVSVAHLLHNGRIAAAHAMSTSRSWPPKAATLLLSTSISPRGCIVVVSTGTAISDRVESNVVR